MRCAPSGTSTRGRRRAPPTRREAVASSSPCRPADGSTSPRSRFTGVSPLGGGVARPALRHTPGPRRARGEPPERRRTARAGAARPRLSQRRPRPAAALRGRRDPDRRRGPFPSVPRRLGGGPRRSGRGGPRPRAASAALPGRAGRRRQGLALGPRHGGRSSRARVRRGPRPGRALPRHARGPAPHRRRLRRRGRPRRARRDRLRRGALTHERALGPARRGPRARGRLPAGRPRPRAGGRLRPGPLREREGVERPAPGRRRRRRPRGRRTPSVLVRLRRPLGERLAGSPPSSTSSTATSSVAASRSACAASTIPTTGPSGRSGAFPSVLLGVGVEGWYERRRTWRDGLFSDRQTDTSEASLQLSRTLSEGLSARLYGRYRTSRVFEDDPFFPLDVTIEYPYVGGGLVWDDREDPLLGTRGLLATLDLETSGDWLGSSFSYARAYGQASYLPPPLRPRCGPRRLGPVAAARVREGLPGAGPDPGRPVLRGRLLLGAGLPDREPRAPRRPRRRALPDRGLDAPRPQRRAARSPPPHARRCRLLRRWARSGPRRATSGQGLATSLGLGLRALTPIGVLRLDGAVPLDRRPGDPAYRVYFGFGNVF